MTEPENPGPGMHRDGRQMPEPERRVERLLGLLMGGLMLLNFPLLSIFSVSAFFYGIPVLYCYLFCAWALIIGITAYILRSRPSGPGTASGGRDSAES